jgi:hypothetical protein
MLLAGHHPRPGPTKVTAITVLRCPVTNTHTPSISNLALNRYIRSGVRTILNSSCCLVSRVACFSAGHRPKAVIRKELSPEVSL